MIQWWTKKRLTVANQRGLMLVELMVAMSIFLLVLIGIFQVFDPSRGEYQVSEHRLVLANGTESPPHWALPLLWLMMSVDGVRRHRFTQSRPWTTSKRNASRW